MVRNDRLFLVVGATGAQGGATARALLAEGNRVRAMTRDADGQAAAALRQAGAEVAQADLDAPEQLTAALEGVYGVFSVLRPDADGSDSERRHGLALIEAARKSGVRHFVHSSVCQAGQHESFPQWGEDYWAERYWTDKWDVEQAVRAAGFEHWTMLRPSFIMQNFAQPRADMLFPQLRQGTIVTPVLPEVPLQLIAAEDIGAFARAAFADPARFDRQNIELAGDTLTNDAVAAVLGDVLGKRVVAKSVSPDEAIEAGIYPRWVRAQEWTNAVGYRVDTSALPPYGVNLTSFADWARQHVSELAVDG